MSTVVLASQRRALRRAVRFRCQVVREHDFRLVGRTALDLSPDGILVETSARVLTGEELIVSFRLPRSRLWFDVSATVARVVHGRRPTDLGRALGLSFDDLDGAGRRAIRAALHDVAPPVPARAPRVDYAATAHFIALQ